MKRIIPFRAFTPYLDQIAMPATEPRYIFEETDDGLEISSHAGTIMVCKVGDSTALPVGTALLIELDGGPEIAGMIEIPLEYLWLNLAGAGHAPENLYCLHPVDYDAAVRVVKKINDRAA
jgi:hypothetical protein